LLGSWLVNAEGGAVGNGGGFSLCADKKMYSYDYLLTLQNPFGTSRTGMPLNEQLQFIGRQLIRLEEPFAAEFKEFISIIYTETVGKPFQWFVRRNLNLLWEPDLTPALPAECRVRKQAVYYFAPFGGVKYASYTYDPDLISLVQSQPEGDLQVSYLWVHEWLWNHFTRITFQQLAAFNRLLHSEALSSMNPSEYSEWRSKFFK
jgi:hypothetical protein